MSAILIDSNVLLYVFDANAFERQDQAEQIMRQLEMTTSGRLSVQCLAEFMNVSTRRLKPPLSMAEASQQVELFARSFPVFDLTVPIVLEAARASRDHHLAYYDAQLWATAKLHQVPVVLSEDFNDGQIIEGVRFVNPFAPKFTLANWI